MSDHQSKVDLGRFDDDFTQVQLEEREFGEIPDGTYPLVVERVELVQAESSERPMLKLTLRMPGPTDEGSMLLHHQVISPGAFD